MSVVQNPFIGRARQKAGGMVFSTWKGINVLKTKPLTVANPKTDKQLMRRSALRQIVELARQITAALQLGFKEQAVFKSAFNAFTGYNLRAGFDYTLPPAATILMSNLLVSQGTISQTPMDSIDVTEAPREIVFNWDPSALQPGQSASDNLCFAIVGIEDKFRTSGMTSALRSAGSVTVSLSAFAYSSGNNVAVYTFFYNVANRKSSDSNYAAEVIQP